MLEKYKLKRNLIIFTAVLTVTFVITMLLDSSVSAKNAISKVQTEIENKNSKQAEKVLSDIDKYQAQYFTIIKRNDVLLNWEDNKKLNKDRKELDKLFNKVKKQITNKEYLKEYKQIEKRYSKCDADNTVGINEFAESNYNEVDALLNKTYSEVKSKISPNDFQNLVLSEKEWLKEVESYAKVYDSMEYGTIGALIRYDYEINMREFRTLLLMLYL